MKFIDNLCQYEYKFNHTEEQIIKYILDHSSSFDKIRINDIADSLYVSPNTIIRLCKKLGYRGYSDLKYDVLSSETDRKDHSTQMYSAKLSVTECIEKTLSFNKECTISRIAELIQSSNRIFVFSFGLSHYTALPFVKELQCLGKICIAPQDRDENVLFAENLLAEDLAIVISFSGSTNIIVNLASIIKSKKIPLVSITSLSQNYLASVSDFELYAYMNKFEYNNQDISSRLGFSVILELLVNELKNRILI